MYVASSDDWPEPTILEEPEIQFMQEINEIYGTDLKATVPITEETKTTLSYQSPMKEGVYLNRFASGNEGIYQLAVIPSQLMEASEPKNVCFLINFRGDMDVILPGLKRMIIGSLAPGDSINIIFSGLQPQIVLENGWVPADSAEISNIFDTISDQHSSTYSTLPILLLEGMNFINNNGGGSLILISDNVEINTIEKANDLMRDLGEYKPWPPIHVCDMNGYQYNFWIEGIRYYGNEYFYGLLTRQTAGNYLSIRNINDYEQILRALLESIGGYIGSFDMYTTLDNGYLQAHYPGWKILW